MGTQANFDNKIDKLIEYIKSMPRTKSDLSTYLALKMGERREVFTLQSPYFKSLSSEVKAAESLKYIIILTAYMSEINNGGYGKDYDAVSKKVHQLRKIFNLTEEILSNWDYKLNYNLEDYGLLLSFKKKFESEVNIYGKIHSDRDNSFDFYEKAFLEFSVILKNIEDDLPEFKPKKSRGRIADAAFDKLIHSLLVFYRKNFVPIGVEIADRDEDFLKFAIESLELIKGYLDEFYGEDYVAGVRSMADGTLKKRMDRIGVYMNSNPSHWYVE